MAKITLQPGTDPEFADQPVHLRDGYTREPTPSHLLPDMAACFHPSTGQIVLIKRDEVGYWPAPMFHDDAALADRFNERRGITPAQRDAMRAGSVFGWHVPGARHDRADELYGDAKPLAQTSRKPGSN